MSIHLPGIIDLFHSTVALIFKMANQDISEKFLNKKIYEDI